MTGWARKPMTSYDHAHSGTRYVSPAERSALYQAAKNQHPRHWSGNTRNWRPIPVVTLNPGRVSVADAVLNPLNQKRKSA